MGVSNYDRLLKIDSGYIRYGLIIRANFQSKITPTARYFGPTLIVVRKSPECVLRAKGRD
jgi:hypothetical protein